MTKPTENQAPLEEADYLINRSTHTCLTVLGGTCPEDAVLGMAPCTGTKRQQWYRSGNGQWQWGGNRAYCLVPHSDARRVELGYLDTSSATSWVFDASDRLVSGDLALDVPWESPRSAVILWPKHNGNNQKWWTLSKLRTSLDEGDEPVNGMVPTILGSGWKDALKKSREHEDEHPTQQSKKQLPKKNDPDSFINQSTLTCLSVTGSNPGDAVIGMSPYTGSVQQRWCLKDGQCLWGANHVFCLEVDPNTLSVKLCDSTSSSSKWTLGDDGVLATETHALDVPWNEPRTSVVAWPKHGRENQKWWRLSRLCDSVGRSIYPFPSSDVAFYRKETAREIINRITPITKPLPYPRDVKSFPGAVSPEVPRVSKTFTLDLSVLGQMQDLRMTVPRDWQATDLYVAPGEVFNVVLPDDLPPEHADQIQVRLGAHCDCLDLDSTNVVDQKKFKRMPVVTDVFEVFPGENALRSQFGGSLIFMFDEGDNFVTTAEVRNAVEAPFYRLGTTSKKMWDKVKLLDAPYSVLESERFVIVVPTTSARRITDPEELLQRYDLVMEKLDDLCGFTDREPPPRGKYWLVEDVQISCGSAHSGFPVMFDRQYYDLTSLKTPYHWVISHEMGHNYQQGPYWSNAYGSESTVNLFSVFVEEELKTGNRLKDQNDYTSAAKAVDEGTDFEAADCWKKLVFLMEIKHAFPEQGWDMFRQLNRTTRALSQEEAEHLASDTQHQFDYVYKMLSKSVSRDLIQTYKRWGINISKDAQDEIRQLGLKEAPRDLSLRT